MTVVVPLHPQMIDAPIARPLPPRRPAPAILTLGTRVLDRPAQDHPGAGTVWGVVHAARPIYDVKTDDGRFLMGLGPDQVETIDETPGPA